MSQSLSLPMHFCLKSVQAAACNWDQLLVGYLQYTDSQPVLFEEKEYCGSLDDHKHADCRRFIQSPVSILWSEINVLSTITELLSTITELLSTISELLSTIAERGLTELLETKLIESVCQQHIICHTPLSMSSITTFLSNPFSLLFILRLLLIALEWVNYIALYLPAAWLYVGISIFQELI